VDRGVAVGMARGENRVWCERKTEVIKGELIGGALPL
jgi:hypothetical protein